MKAGFGQREITPRLGCIMEGFNLTEPAVAIHDPLHVRAVWLEDDDAVVIAALDLLFLERPEVDRLKQAIRLACGLEPSRILLNFSHTHSGPRLTRWHYSGKPEPAYLEMVTTATVEAILAAKASCRPVHMAAGMGRTDLPISRRHPDANGIAQWGPCATEPTCQALPVVLFTEESGQIVAGLVSVSCHPTINHTNAISAEYPGVAVAELNRRFDTDGFVFLQGAGGDTKPRNIAVGDDHFRDGSWDDVAEAGRQVADAVAATIDAGLTQSAPTLRVAMQEMRLPLAALPERESLTELARQSGAPGRPDWARDLLCRLASDEGLPEEATIRVHLVQLAAEVRLIGVEAELGGELGCQLVAQCGTGVTFPLGYSNGVRLNLPCDRQLPQGGYGVTTAWEFHWPAPLAPGIDARLATTVRQLQQAICPS